MIGEPASKSWELILGVLGLGDSLNNNNMHQRFDFLKIYFD
jgi:hypothetical protein